MRTFRFLFDFIRNLVGSTLTNRVSVFYNRYDIVSSLRPTFIGLQILQAISHDFEEEVAVLSEPSSSAGESARSSKFHCIPIESSPLSMQHSDRFPPLCASSFPSADRFRNHFPAVCRAVQIHPGYRLSGNCLDRRIHPPGDADPH